MFGNNVMPYYEQQAIYEQIDFGESPWENEKARNFDLARSQPEMLLCPSEFVQRGLDSPMGWTNYHANAGSWVQFTKRWDGVFGPDAAVAGYEKLPPISFGMITDGLSNTAAFAEMRNGMGDTTVADSGDDQATDCYEGRGQASSATIAEARTKLQAQVPRRVPWGGKWRFRGNPWTEGTMWRTWYNHVFTPGELCWKVGDWWDLVSPPSSYHAGMPRRELEET